MPLKLSGNQEKENMMLEGFGMGADRTHLWALCNWKCDTPINPYKRSRDSPFPEK
ncbi:hypothetical protein CsSME_00041761 [Camellia sinensis var. sinensis]